MNRLIKLSVILIALVAIPFNPAAAQDPDAGWQTPPEEIMKVLHAPQLPMISTSPTGEYLFMAEPLQYPPLLSIAPPLPRSLFR